MPDVELIREALARELGRTQARDEMAELSKEVHELKSAMTENTGVLRTLTGAVTTLQQNLQRLPGPR